MTALFLFLFISYSEPQPEPPNFGNPPWQLLINSEPGPAIDLDQAVDLIEQYGPARDKGETLLCIR